MKVLGHFPLSQANEQSIIVQDIPFVNYLHRHKEMQVSYIYKGSGTLVVGNCVKQFKAGDVYIIGADQPHLFKSDAAQQDIGSIHVYIEYKKNLEGFLSIQEMKQIKNFLEKSDYGFQVPKKYTTRIIKNISKIRTSHGFQRLMGILQLLNEFVDISGWQPLSTGLYNYSFDGTERLNAIYQYTMQNYHNDITINEIASVACMTPHAFCKYFKKYTLKTYLTFLNEYRIGEACKKLISEEYNCISAIAYCTGFSNIITFNRVFKKSMKLTPTQYIAQFKKKESLIDIRTLGQSA